MDFAIADIQFVYQQCHLVYDTVWSLPIQPEFGIDTPLQMIYVVLGDPDFVTFHELLLTVTGIIAMFNDNGSDIHGQLYVSLDMLIHILYLFCF